MSNANVRLPEDWRRFDRTGLIGAIVFPLLLGALWLLGMGPTAYEACETAKAPLELNLFSENGKIAITGKVASAADKQVVIKAAEKIYGAQKIIDKVEVARSILPLTWASHVEDLVGKLKSIDEPASLKIAGAEAVLEGIVADKAARDSMGKAAQELIGKDVKVKNLLTIRQPQPAAPKPEPAPAPAPPPAAAPAPAPQPIASGTLGKYKLPDGTEIGILGEGFETKVIAFIEDVSKQVDKGIWFDFDRLQFETGSSKLTAESKAQVETVAAILKAYPNVAIKIGGYTDNVGNPDSNLKLSSTRAERVMQELIAQGIAADRLESEGYGEQHPVADNATEEGRAKNRRTAVSIRRK